MYIPVPDSVAGIPESDLGVIYPDDHAPGYLLELRHKSTASCNRLRSSSSIWTGPFSDPVTGVCRCLNYSLTAFASPEVTEREVAPYIGPPLDSSFRQITGKTSDKRIAAMVARYRERSSPSVRFPAGLYP